MNMLLTWLFSTLAVIGGSYILPGASVDSFGVALVVAAVLGLISITLKPVLEFLALPVNVLTLGLFSLVINALLIMLVDSFIPGFAVGGFVSALLLSIVMSIIMMILGSLAQKA